MSDTVLARISKAEALLAQVTDIGEAAEISDLAAAAAVYAKRQSATIPVINRAISIKLQAERKAGELLRKMPKSKHHVNSSKMEELKVTHKQSHTWQLIAAVPEPEFRKYIDNCNRSNTQVTTSGLYRLAKTYARKKDPKPKKFPSGIVADLSELSGQTFGCIYADPPWRYDNQATRASTDNHYDTLSVDEICEMPIGELAAEQAHLHLWTTNAFLFECPKIFEAWGFEYKSTFVWVKPQMGIGNYWRNAHEILLTGIRGKQRSVSKSEISWVQARRGRHSAKPDAVRDSIQRLSPGPYLELFGRRRIPNWTVFGNQIVEELI